MSGKLPPLALLCTTFVGAALVLYGSALHGPFVSDDLHYVSQNEHVKSLSLHNLAVIFDPVGPVTVDVVNYAPLQLLVHSLAWRAFGAETFGHHVVNVVLHALASVLLVVLLASTGAPRAGAVVAGAVFLVHPANVEAVAWVSQLKSTLSLPLAFGALLAYRRRPALALALFAAALLAKPTAACVLPVAFLLEWSRGERVRWGWLAGWALVLAAFTVVEFATHQRTGAADAALHAAPFLLLRTMAGLAARYVVMAASGCGLSAFHEPEPARSLLDPWWLLGVLLAGVVAWRSLRAWRTRSAELAYWVWAVGAFAPVSQVFPFLYPLADRYLYFMLPGLLGAVLLAGRAALAGLSPPRRALAGRVALGFGVVLLALFAVRTPQRAALWRSNTALLVDAAVHYPDGKVANVLRAKRAAQNGDLAGSVAALRRAYERGFNRFEQLETDASYAPVREAPEFRALLREMASGWIESGRDKPDPTPSELRTLAHAHIVRGEYEDALRLLERAAALAGPYQDTIAAEATAIRAALAAGTPERIRLR